MVGRNVCLMLHHAGQTQMPCNGLGGNGTKHGHSTRRPLGEHGRPPPRNPGPAMSGCIVPRTLLELQWNTASLQLESKAPLNFVAIAKGDL